MGDRRMLTKKVTDDDNFMALSSSAQALYLHLSMSADDDGFCNQVSICMFKAHASVQDLQALLEKRYIYQFDNGVIVIKHWRMANALRKDRYTPTAFQEELAKLKLKENGAYTWLPDGCQEVAERLPDGCPNISKVNLSKDNINNTPLPPKGGKGVFVPPTLEEVEAYCKSRNSTVDPKQFWEYFDAGDWIDSKGQKVRSWKQKLITWEKGGYGNAGAGNKPGTSGGTSKVQGKYDGVNFYDNV